MTWTVSGRLSRQAPRLVLAAGALALGAGGALGAQILRANLAPAHGGVRTDDVRAALKLRLPRTAIRTIDCRSLPGLCEVVTGSSLFYVDPTARFLVIGHVYDMEERSDVTAARLLALDPAKLVPPGRRENTDESSGESVAAKTAARVSLSELPDAGSIAWGAKSGPRLVILSDFACGYCRKLSDELARLNIQIEERPISIFGARSRRIAEQVLCAADPVAALHAAYRGEKLLQKPGCDVRGLDANEAFARRHGFTGTPVLIRADGAVLEGYRPAAIIKAFVDGKSA